MASSSEIKEEYTSSLQDLTFNSKPLINVLTILAEENVAHAKEIVEAVEEHLKKVPTEVKLPILYLIDCIIKNVGQVYTTLFCQNIVSTFCNVFEMVDERTRAEMFRLRQTWNDVIPMKKLYALDVQIHLLDPAWPVTAPPPTNSIHFNPKFLIPNTKSASKKDSVTPTTKPGTTPIIPVSSSAVLDPATLNMQQKLINKQRQLLELQQRKLELELLQTQVKLQEQLKCQTVAVTTSSATVPSKVTLPHAPNLLLKPEVAKQLAHTNVPSKLSSSTAINKSKQMPYAVSSMMRPNMQSIMTSTVGTGPRIAPVSRALIQAQAKPIRDPRLLRHQQYSNNNSNVHLESKSLKSNNSSDIVITDNKVVNNKMSVRQNEPRFINNKDSSLVQGKAKAEPRSPSKINSKTSSPRKPKIPRSSKSSGSTSDLSDTKGESSRSSTSSLGSPSKSKSDVKSQSPSKFPVKLKKKEGASTRTDKKSEKHSKSPKSDKDSKLRKSDLPPTTFKEIKVSAKNRNYVRRNHEASDVGHDVDLRHGAPPEKQARVQGDSADDKSGKVDVASSSPGKDVDLRQLPAAVIGKKRPSTESTESPCPKKSKPEIDVLFGNEDTDLRQLPVILTSPKTKERPPTPPPPIISAKVTADAEEYKENPENKESPPKTNLDVLRAKLANATSKSKLDMKFNFLFEKKKEVNKNLHEDTDMRNLVLKSPDDKLNKIIISPADEQCIKAGNMTKAQEAALMNKIIAQIETQKLREAQRKESESVVNVSLQPISDDELDADFSNSEGEEDPYMKQTGYGDKDDRHALPPPHPNQSVENYPKFPRAVDSRDPRRAGPGWRGRRRSKMLHWDSTYPTGQRPSARPGVRPTTEPWLRPIAQTHSPWRPMGPPFLNPPMHQDNYPPNLMENSPENVNLPPHLVEQGSASPSFPGQEVPSDLVLDYVDQDNIRTINIDAIPRAIRYYDETAVAFMDWDDPREISFQNGTRRVIFDDKEAYALSFNEPYRDVSVRGKLHRVRLGAPTREIYIDGQWYECYFGGPGIGIEIDGKITVVKMDGPPPQVKIGTVKRTDLCGGKIRLIINAKTLVPVFLDAKTQKFDIDGKIHTLRFVDALRTVLINDIPFKVEFGGLPKPITVYDKKHFIRFSVLPKGIRPGHVHLKDMEGSNMSPRHDESSQDGHAFDVSLRVSEPPLPPFNKRKFAMGGESPERNSSSPSQFQNIMHQQNLSNLDVLSNVMASSLTPATGPVGYQVENVPQPETQAVTAPEVPATGAPVPVQPAFVPSININELFQKLVATGMVMTEHPPQVDVTSAAKTRSQNNLRNIKPVSFDRTETLKTRQPSLVHALYLGMQCSSCGMRFPPEQSMYYSQHLDWHFRQNRKGKRNIRKAASRRWYYNLADWKNYEEIEDLEEREKCYFENQQQSQLEGGSEDAEEEIEIPSVPADPSMQDAICEVCQDKFEQFYNEEKEEWHLRMAFRIEGKTYHPLCYEDYQASLVEMTLDESGLDLEKRVEKSDDSIPGLEIVILDETESKADQDDDLELIIEDSNDSPEANIKEASLEAVPGVVENGSTAVQQEEECDDDVIINEIVPEKIVVDDDDGKEDYSDGLIPGVVVKEEPIDDGFMDVEDALVKVRNGGEIKTQPVPTHLEESVPQPEELKPSSADTTHAQVISSIEGNVELDSGVPAVTTGLSGSKIKINITKPLPVIQPKESTNKEPFAGDINIGTEILDPNQPLPPGEEPIQLNLKPALQGVNLKKLPVVEKGTELTGLCSIM